MKAAVRPDRRRRRRRAIGRGVVRRRSQPGSGPTATAGRPHRRPTASPGTGHVVTDPAPPIGGRPPAPIATVARGHRGRRRWLGRRGSRRRSGDRVGAGPRRRRRRGQPRRRPGRRRRRRLESPPRRRLPPRPSPSPIRSAGTASPAAAGGPISATPLPTGWGPHRLNRRRPSAGRPGPPNRRRYGTDIGDPARHPRRRRPDTTTAEDAGDRRLDHGLDPDGDPPAGAAASAGPSSTTTGPSTSRVATAATAGPAAGELAAGRGGARLAGARGGRRPQRRCRSGVHRRRRTCRGWLASSSTSCRRPRPTAAGTYTVTIALHPEELGEVRATVTAGEDQVTVRLVAATGDGDDALRQALSQLHADLSVGGQRTTVTVGGRGGDVSTGWTAGQPTADGQADGRPDAEDAAANGASTGDAPAGRDGRRPGRRSPTGRRAPSG